MPQETRTVYFDTPGRDNTPETLRIAAARAAELGIRDVVVASYSGDTGVQVVQAMPDANVIVVAGTYGFREPNTVAMLPENRIALAAAGAQILHAGHAFGMLGRAVNRRFEAIQVDEIIAHVLRLLGAGVKVGCEITCMAADAGLVQAGSEVLAIAGTGRGADTAVIVRASNTHLFFETRILEILCKPRG